ncbi:MAG: sulfatase [Pirellulaceae bacterium]|nr:sulfatase [Pirellulaceae bacterium]
MQRTFIFLLTVTSLATSILAQEKPNLIIINVDDLGYADIGPYGSKNNTPNLERMAAEGRKLASHYAAPVCSPSRASLMTGCYPKRALPIPHVLFPAASVGLNPDEVTIAEVLKSVGYSTACFGKWHLGDQPGFLPTDQGFDTYYGIPYSNDMGPAVDGSKSNPDKPLPKAANAKVNVAKTEKRLSDDADETGMKGSDQPPLPLLENAKVVDRVRVDEQFDIVRRYTNRAVKYIQEQKDNAFFLYLPHTAVHFPLYPSSDFRDKSPNGLLGDWTQEVDWSVGKVLATLRELNLDRKTLVIFTSDNGGPLNQGANNHPLRGGKGQTLEGGIRVCTIAWWPGKVPAGTSTNLMTSMMDILPTFAKLGGAKVPADRKIDGVDIWPVLDATAGDKPPRDHFFYFRGLNLDAVRSGPWKLQLANSAAASGKKGQTQSSNQLFNLDDDISESKDVALQNPEIVMRLLSLAQSMHDDLGVDKIGPGCRPLGRVANPEPLMNADGKVRANAIGSKAVFP